MSEVQGYASIETDDGYRSDSNTATKEELKKIHAPKDKAEKAEKEKPEKPDISKAASELGKRGGKAAAEKRAAEKPKAGEEEEDDKPEQKAKPAKAADDEKAEPESDGPEKEAKADDVEEEEKPKAKPRDDVHERIRQLSETARRREAELAQEREERRRERQKFEERLEAIERRSRGEAEEPARGERRPSPAAEGEDAKPTADQFDNYEEYLDARDAYNRRQWESEASRRMEVHQRAKTYVDSHMTEMQAHSKRIEEALAADPALNEKIDPRIAYPPTWALEDGQEPGALNYLANAFIRSKQGPYVMAYLSEHKDVLDEILRDSMEAFRGGHSVPDCHDRAKQAIARGIGMVEAEVRRGSGAEKPKAERQEVSRAKPPVPSVNASPHSSEEARVWSEETSYDDHVSLMNARDKRKR